MLSLYGILKASKTGIAPDMWTALTGMNWGGADSGHEVKELTGIPPLSFKADGTPLLDWYIKGNTMQNGTPTPDNPIQPQSCGERTGNLLNYTTVGNTQTATATQITNGISISGKYFVRFRTVKFIIGRSYTMAWTAKTISGKVTPMWRLHYSDNTYSSLALNGESLVADKEVSWLLLYINGSSTENGVAEFTDIMLNTGSTALPYEPFGVKIPISNNSQTTNVYLGEVQSTRQIKKLVLTGEETVQYVGGNAPYRISVPGLKIPTLSQVLWMCSHYQAVPSSASWSRYDSLISWHSGDNSATLRFRDTSKADVSAFKAFLSSEYSNGTPVTIWYVLATPTTGIVNEPLMKIGDYADTLSMEQAEVSIPTVSGTNTIDVETTLKPSEMYIKYQE